MDPSNKANTEMVRMEARGRRKEGCYRNWQDWKDGRESACTITLWKRTTCACSTSAPSLHLYISIFPRRNASRALCLILSLPPHLRCGGNLDAFFYFCQSVTGWNRKPEMKAYLQCYTDHSCREDWGLVLHAKLKMTISVRSSRLRSLSR